MVEVNSTIHHIGVTKTYIRTASTDILKALKFKKDARLGIHIVGESKIRSLNHRYRRKDKVTDVLSFPVQESTFPAVDEVDLGDVFICAPQIRRQAKEYEVTYTYEFTRMLVHGILHIAGYDHIKPKDARIMMPLQEKILTSIMNKK